MMKVVIPMWMLIFLLIQLGIFSIYLIKDSKYNKLLALPGMLFIIFALVIIKDIYLW